LTRGAAEAWHALLRPDVELSPAYWESLSADMRAARLTFGDRLHCPFLRPFFLGRADVHRVTRVAEAVARVGEKVVDAAMDSPALLDDLGLSEAERALAAIEPGYGTASTASRLDAFLLPDALSFAEYNAESPAGLGYSETLAEIFDALPVMARFKLDYDASFYRLSSQMLDALLESYRDWGGTADPPTIAIVDWRDVPTWTEFEILKARFEARGVPTLVCDPRELAFDGTTLAAEGRRIDLVYRRVLINDIVARPDETRALVDAYRARAACVANTLRCKIPHKKAFFAVLTNERYQHLFTIEERAMIASHVPWTRLLRDGRTTAPGGVSIDLVDYVRRLRDDFVIKPNDEYGGSGVVLGWECDERAWDEAIARALADASGVWVAQRKVRVRREVFPLVETPHRVVMRDMLVDLAPYLFRGRVGGFLTRLSATGLANVTSGGGQVPSFVVEPRQE
jgi:hypothetical protein